MCAVNLLILTTHKRVATRLAPRLAGKQLGVVICGNNIGAEVLAGIISERSAADSGPRL